MNILHVLTNEHLQKQKFLQIIRKWGIYYLFPTLSNKYAFLFNEKLLWINIINFYLLISGKYLFTKSLWYLFHLFHFVGHTQWYRNKILLIKIFARLNNYFLKLFCFQFSRYIEWNNAKYPVDLFSLRIFGMHMKFFNRLKSVI